MSARMRERRGWMPFRLKVAVAVGLVAGLSTLLLAGVYAANQPGRVRERVAAENLQIAQVLAVELEAETRAAVRVLTILAQESPFRANTLDPDPLNVR